MNKKVHYDRLNKAIRNKKLLIFQYSSSDINKKPIKITTVFAIDYFTDEEWCVLGNDPEFKKKVIKFLDTHKDYHFLFWNFNIDYSFQNFDLGFNDNKLRNLINRCIDFDDVCEIYAENRKQKYIQKVSGGFDSRYYLALLNKIKLNSDWIWGGNEISIKNQEVLKKSSRIKTKVMARILDKFIDNTLKVKHDDRYIRKSKEIVGWRGKLKFWKRYVIKGLVIAGLYLLARLIEFIFGLIFTKPT